jgi:hypothetical protein
MAAQAALLLLVRFVLLLVVLAVRLLQVQQAAVAVLVQVEHII